MPRRSSKRPDTISADSEARSKSGRGTGHSVSSDVLFARYARGSCRDAARHGLRADPLFFSRPFLSPRLDRTRYCNGDRGDDHPRPVRGKGQASPRPHGTGRLGCVGGVGAVSADRPRPPDDRVDEAGGIHRCGAGKEPCDGPTPEQDPLRSFRHRRHPICLPPDIGRMSCGIRSCGRSQARIGAGSTHRAPSATCRRAANAERNGSENLEEGFQNGANSSRR